MSTGRYSYRYHLKQTSREGMLDVWHGHTASVSFEMHVCLHKGGWRVLFPDDEDDDNNNNNGCFKSCFY